MPPLEVISYFSLLWLTTESCYPFQRQLLRSIRCLLLLSNLFPSFPGCISTLGSSRLRDLRISPFWQFSFISVNHWEETHHQSPPLSCLSGVPIEEV
ncbi:hypothetical protein F4778DRAFT_216489 [Xylariomycetidae sp. FL2044]|nr:hypothetical protein F4778DRAFT_216489 [Xylariomycetidae sp. FL2044]